MHLEGSLLYSTQPKTEQLKEKLRNNDPRVQKRLRVNLALLKPEVLTEMARGRDLEYVSPLNGPPKSGKY